MIAVRNCDCLKEEIFVKKIAILGSTGSIGTQTLEIVRDNPDLQVTGLAAGANIELLERQVREFRPRLVSLQSEADCEELKTRLADMEVQVIPGMEGLLAIAQMEESEILVTAIVGMIGIRPTIAAINRKKDIALANKETLVTAGHIIMPLAAKMGVSILPVDSEHSAIFQSMQGENRDRVSRLLITASGGPFRGRTRQELETVRLEDALKHPNWSMGHKITIDSATLVNKGLEVMLVNGGLDSGGGASAEHYSLNGRVCGWRHYGAAWCAGYETADTVCPVLSGQTPDGRKTG